MTPEENIEFYNFKTEKKLKRLRENLKTFEDKNIHTFTSLILASENYEETLDQSESIKIRVKSLPLLILWMEIKKLFLKKE